MANIEVVQEFVGKNRKRYVLLHWSNLAHGNWDSGYKILQLIPRSKGGLPFVVYSLLGVNEPESGFCGEWKSTDASEKTQKSTVTDYKVFNEGTEKVQIVFSLKGQGCKTLQMRFYKKKFSLNNTKFFEEKDATKP